MALDVIQRMLVMLLCVCLAAVVPIVTLGILSTQDPSLLARELLSDPECLQCNDVRRRCDILVDGLPMLPPTKEAAPGGPPPEKMLNLDCGQAKGTKKTLLRTLCEKGARVPVSEAANLLLRSVCEAGPRFKQCSAFMNRHREGILNLLTEALAIQAKGSAQPQARSDSTGGELPPLCWSLCEARLKLLDQVALQLVKWASRPEVQHITAVAREAWGALLVMGMTACLLGTALHLRASLCARGVKIRILVTRSQQQQLLLAQLQQQQQHAAVVPPLPPPPGAGKGRTGGKGRSQR
jgi:hypothetical protein